VGNSRTYPDGLFLVRDLHVSPVGIFSHFFGSLHSGDVYVICRTGSTNGTHDSLEPELF
jgi:hypothetical protein